MGEPIEMACFGGNLESKIIYIEDEYLRQCIY